MYPPGYHDLDKPDFDKIMNYESRQMLIEKAMEEPEDPSISKKKKGCTKPKHRRKKR